LKAAKNTHNGGRAAPSKKTLHGKREGVWGENKGTETKGSLSTEMGNNTPH